MNSLTQEQKARVFAMYTGAPLNYQCPGEVAHGHVMGVNMAYEQVLVCDQEGQDVHGIEVDDCQLLLRPVSSISDEDAIEIAAVVYNDPGIKARPNLKSILEYVRLNLRDKVNDAVCFQLFIERGYNVPLQVLGGKTPIESGLAIEVQ